MSNDTNLAPLPARVVVDRHLPTGLAIYGYTDDMVRAYAAEQVAAERERLAQMFDVPATIHGEIEDWSRGVAVRIRGA